ncbi:helix-turn-helix transcriptional regulator [Streptomyces sp. BR123]|jgi:DNA-binding CsgD family transcriptional regulator|uniref:response regulator transcription factor n=1 Tax=Streptomyces sp. BR123 TaxID=2749828 RepID=UPI0015C446A6|nr:helix-turn-helix transcriptional regulator [Streptomyces sp. BR123]NXY95624.1 helix-turn-helix transcriptional regulator [Streptomyces sp. BR123]
MSLTLTAPAPSTAPAAEATASALAPREQEALRHIASGCTYLQTARNMGLSKHTVDAYLRRIRAKLGINTTAEMTRLAVSMGL